MNTLTKLIAFYFINLIFFFLIGVLFESDIPWLVTSLRTWLFPFFVVIAGLFFGYLTVTVQKLTRKRIAYNYSLTIVSLIAALMLFGTRYSDWKHERDFGNIEANNDYFKYFTGQYEYEKKLAFDILSTKFVGSNDFRILGNFTDTNDSIINGDMRTVYSMTYFYQKKGDENFYKAIFTVFDGKANLLNYDEVLNLNDYSKIVRFGRDVRVTLTKAWRELPDSVKKQIQKEFPELSD